ncbi:MAG TPA: fatty acid desaturase CarF family protein [Tepidisphaeraceae bacterium]|nr:fatty acid desaturase CarF family protein [Tepidisphaeraceae bacterium]
MAIWNTLSNSAHFELIFAVIEAARICIEAILAILAADFLSGLVHWTEDTFWSENTPIVGKWIVQPNNLHHKNGTAFLEKNWWQSSWDLVLLGAFVVLVAGMCGMLYWQVWLFAIVGANANQIHKWAHRRSSDLPAPVRILQRLRIFQSFQHHAEHHRHEKNSHYCLITNIANPILDRTRFWRGLESLLVPIFTAPRRTDLSRSQQSFWR